MTCTPQTSPQDHYVIMLTCPALLHALFTVSAFKTPVFRLSFFAALAVAGSAGTLAVAATTINVPRLLQPHLSAACRLASTSRSTLNLGL